MTQFVLAWRYLRGRGIRTFLTTLAVVFGVALIFGLNGLLPAFLQAFNRNLLTTAGNIDVTITSAFAQEFPSSVVDQVTRVPGVALASPQIQRIVPLPQKPNIPAAQQVAQINVVGIDVPTETKVRDFPLQAGRMLSANDVDTAVLSADLAAKLGVRVGGTLTLPSSVGSTKFTVVGLLSVATVPGQEEAFVPLASAQALFALPGKINTIEGSFVKGADHAAIEAALRRSLGSNYDVGGLEANSSLLASISTAAAAFNLFGVFALATGAFIILNSFRTVVSERRHDIGMLRAIGAKRGTIIGMFLVESVFQGIIGTAMGLVLGYFMGLGFIAVVNPFYSAIVHVTIAGPIFTASTWVTSIFLGIGVTIAAAIIPALSAGRVTPMEAMRPQLGEVYERAVGRRAWVGAGLLVAAIACLATVTPGLIGFGAVLFLVGIALVAPVIVSPLANAFGSAVEVVFAREGSIARSNLQRNPGRSAITVTAVMLGLASIIAVLGIVTSIFQAFYGYIDKSLSADYMFIPQSIVLSQGNVGAGPRLADEVRHTPGIAAVGTLRLGRGKVNGSDVQVIGIDPVQYPKVAAFDWLPGSSDQALQQLGAQGQRWVIANGIYSTQHQLKSGDKLVIDTPNGPRTYFVAGIGNDYLNAKLSTLYVSQVNLAQDFNVTSDLLIMANRQPTADPAVVKAKLDKIGADFPGFRLYTSAEWKSTQVGIFNQTFALFYSLIAALALPSLLALINTLAISVLARTREIGMLRAVGSTRRQVRRMVMAESLLLSAIGTALGVVAGVWLGYALVVATNSGTGYNVPYIFPWAGIAVTVVVGITFGVIAALIPARSAARLDVVEALHFE
jgi:putative ABC transport system permease protein